jgi:hypothetical protein
MSCYEGQERPSLSDMWRRKFPVNVVARTQGDAFEKAIKIARDTYDQSKYSVAVLNGENRGVAFD